MRAKKSRQQRPSLTNSPKNKQPRQLGFELLESKALKHFGGAYLKKSHAKTKRPIATKRSMHLVMRSSLAKGDRSLLKHAKAIRNVIQRQSRRFDVRIYRLANAANHLHFVVLPSSRAGFNGFLRSISGLIARIVLGAEKGTAKRLQFWDQRPFTRILEWGKEYQGVLRYLVQNSLEAFGFIAYTPRKQRFTSG